ncbi:P-loop containing nucleoside triphosphate hydrolase protein [Lanmaoa asiatica]|nr:P-loop containing nucleoside triphosphate hydrolase protein [Lanmaoa asiatica]
MPLTSEPQSIQRRSNIVLFGEMGAGKSSLVNLILGLDHDVARISSGASSCTLDARPYDVTIQERDFRIFDTVGLNEPHSLRDPDCLIGAINKAYRLVRYLSDTGGINLLVFCIRRGRITANMQQNYLLFHDFLCHKKVPIAVVITHLENEENMENWWQDNCPHFTECGIHVVGHACITTKRQFGDRYHSSRQAVHDLLISHGCGAGFTQERVSWLTELFQKLLDFVGFQPRLDSFKVRAQKLREYGLREEEIAALLVKISAVDEDMDLVRPLRPHIFTLLRGRRSTHI